MAQTLSCINAWWARMRPDQPAVVLAGEALTYSQYNQWAERVAVHLQELGLKPGQRVAVCAHNSLAYCALIMGIIRAGGIVSPVNFRYLSREIAELLEKTEPSICFAGSDFAGNMGKAGYPARDIAEIEALRDGPVVKCSHDPHPDDKVVIIATSGSTAAPKGVVYTHRSMIAYASNWSLEETSSSAGSRVLALAPLNTSAGFVQLTHYTIQGCTIFMEPSFDPAGVLATIQREKINCWGGVPVFFEAVAALPEFESADLSCITLATAGGAPVTPKLLDTYRKKGIIIRQIYGQTEVGGNATMMPSHLAVDMPEKCGWGGVTMDIRVVREDGTDCEPGEQGEILMRSPGMMVEYWAEPEKTAATIRDGWLYSGDLGKLDERGLLTFVDRLKDLIISGGLNIAAAEVERVVGEFSGIVEVLVIAAPDDKFGETPMAIYHGPEEVDTAALIAHCNERLSNYKVPRYVIYSKEPLPRLATGKLSKPAVRETYANAHKELQRVR